MRISRNTAACISCSTVRRYRDLPRCSTPRSSRLNDCFFVWRLRAFSVARESRAGGSAACRWLLCRIPGRGRSRAFFAFAEENLADHTLFRVLSLSKDSHSDSRYKARNAAVTRSSVVFRSFGSFLSVSSTVEVSYPRVFSASTAS